MLDKETHNYKWGIVATVSLFSIFLFYLNILIPYLPGDDYIFQLKLPEEGFLGNQKITSLSDLVSSQVNFYNNYHYRVFNHTILQVLLLLPPWVFDLLNTITFLALPYCLLKIRENKNPTIYASQYLILLFFIWVFHFNLGRSYFLTTGSLNYTWLLIPQILYLVELFRFNDGKGSSKLIIFLACLNAMSNENVILVLFALTTIVAISKHKENFATLVWCLGIFLAGIIFMLNSPSIALRLEEQGFRDTSLYNHTKEYILRSFYYLIRYSPIVLLYYILINRKSEPRIENLSTSAFNLVTSRNLLIVGIFISFASMAFIPLFEPRSAVFGFFLSIMLVLSLGYGKMPSYPSIVALVLLTICISVFRYPHFLSMNKLHRNNTSILNENRNKDVVVKLNKYCDDSKKSFVLCHEISSDSTYLDNKSLAHYFNVKAVVRHDKNRIHQRRKKIFDEIENKKIDYTNFEELKINDDVIMMKKSTSCELLMISGSEKYFIIRGSKPGLNSHRLVELLPLKHQLPFLSYLEDTTSKEQPSLRQENFYNYNYISTCKEYKYLLISEYSINDHAPLGDIIKLPLGAL